MTNLASTMGTSQPDDAERAKPPFPHRRAPFTENLPPVFRREGSGAAVASNTTSRWQQTVFLYRLIKRLTNWLMNPKPFTQKRVKFESYLVEVFPDI
jgi:hypothetical protein